MRLKWLVFSMALFVSPLFATEPYIPSVEGTVERVYYSDRVIVVDGERYEVPEDMVDPESGRDAMQVLNRGVRVEVQPGFDRSDKPSLVREFKRLEDD